MTVSHTTAAPQPRAVLLANNWMQFLTNGAWYVAIPFFPLYLVSQGATPAVVGLVVGLAGIAPLAISIYAGGLVDERGAFGVYTASTVLLGIGGLLLTAVRGVPAAGVAYTLMAIANIGLAVAAQAIVAAVSSDETRIRNYGYYSLWNSFGAVVGPIAGGFLAARFGYTGAFSALWLVMVPSLGVLARLRGVRTPSRGAVRASAAHRLVGTILRERAVGVILFASGMMVCGQQLQNTFYPLYLHAVGLSAPHIGFLVAAVSLAAMVVRSLLAGGVTRFGTGRALWVSMLFAALAFVCAPLTHNFWLLLAVSGTMGASVGLTQPLTMSLIVAFVTPVFWGVGFGIRQSVQRFAAIVAPLGFGAVGATRVEPAFYAGAILFAGASGLMMRVAGVLERPPSAADR
jgi:MFS family permease